MSKNIFKKVIDKKITRRSFLKWSSAIGATVSLSGLVVNESATMALAGTDAGVTAGTVVDWIPTNCLVCHSWCRIAVGIDANKVVRKIEGVGGQPKPAGTSHTGAAADGTKVLNDSDDTYDRYCKADVGQLPYASHNRGRICAKGNDGMEHMYDPDRVKYPLVRAGKRAAGKWRKVSWGELYLGDQTCTGSPSSQDIMIDNGSGRLMHWQGIARVMRSLGDSAPIPTNSGNGTARGYGYDDNIDSKHYYSDIPAVSGSTPAPDHRHRLLFYIGRNEGGDAWERFRNAFGTHHHIEHTNLCEESRHTANEWYCKDKFPISNLNTHRSGKVITDTNIGGTNQWTLDDRDNCDCFIAVGGNYVETTIPHASLSQRVADVRRRGGRIIGIDVRQSNTLAYADEQFYVKPGTDGALAAGIIYEIMANYVGGVAALKARIDSRVNTGANYVGIFTGTAAAGKSIEEYLFAGPATGPVDNLFLANYGGLATYPDSGAPGRQFTAAYAAGKCGVSETNIKYLAWLMSGGFGVGNSTPPGGLVAMDPPRNPILDGYRGPCKHSNGTYNYGLLRALQFMACGYDDTTSIGGDALTETEKRAGGFNRPGGLVFDSYKQGGGTTAPGNDPAPGSPTDKRDGGWPLQEQGAGPGLGNVQLTDNWDYHGFGGSKWRCGAHHVFSNALIGVRASLGLNPYKEGSTTTVPNSNPFGSDYETPPNPNPATPPNTYDDNFRFEVIFMHKVSAGYDLPNPALDREVFTSVGANGYRLKHLWACDLNMGDSTVYADAILPDSSYLERYDYDSREDVASLGHMSLRQPVIQDEVRDANGNVTVASNGKNLTLYGSKSIRNILYGLGRAIEATGVNANGDTTGTTSYAPWGGSMLTSFNWVTSGSVNESDWSDRDYMYARFNSASGMPLGYADGFEYYCTNGTYEGSNDHWPNFWKNDYHKVDSAAFTGGAGKVEFYHARLDQVEDPTASPNEVGTHDLVAPFTFYGTPIYEPPRKQGAFSAPDVANGKYNLTTYRLNVHTNARTASCPRLEEIISQNWAVMAPDAKDISGTPIKNGDKVRITSMHDDGISSAAIYHKIELEAKVTPKISSGVVAISHSQGHDLKSFGGDGMGGQGYDIKKGSAPYIHNREDASAYTTSEYAALDQYRIYLAPSAPSTSYNPVSKTTEPTVTGLNHGTHVNWAINRGGEDPVGTSVAYMDTMVTVEII